MDASIRRLHCRYRVVDGSTAALQARLDHMLPSEIASAVDQSLDSALRGDPTVYVLRQVCVKAVIHNQGGVPTRAAVEHLGRRFATAILKTIACSDPENLITFRDRAEYVACFLRDLFQGS